MATNTPTTFEQKWPTVILAPISVVNHIITVSDTAGLHTKAKITLSIVGQEPLDLEVKRVLNDTQIQVGYENKAINAIENPVAYSGGMLTMSEQNRNRFGSELVLRAVYEEEPATALRNVLVNRYGAFIDADNPLPIAFDGTIAVGNVTIQDDDGDEMSVNPDGSINVNVVSSFNGDPVNTFDQVTSVVANSFTNIVSYTVPTAKKGYLFRVNFGGDNIAEYEIFKNEALIGKVRTWFGGNLFASLEWTCPDGSGEPLVAGDVLLIRVRHYRPTVGTFEGTIQTLILDV